MTDLDYILISYYLFFVPSQEQKIITLDLNIEIKNPQHLTGDLSHQTND